MRSIPPKAMELIERFEGLSLKRYIDATGNPTIGFGHMIKPHENLFEITEDDAISLLHSDMQLAATSVLRLTSSPLNDNQYAALIDFVYNLGAGIYQASTLRAMLNRGDYNNADKQFNRWVYGGARKLPGLIIRRQVETQLFCE